MRFRLGGDDPIVPRQVFHEELQDNLTVYPTAGRKLLEPGRYVFTPGNMVLRLEAGSLVAEHPAIRVDAGGVGIRCAPVRFAALDAAGAPLVGAAGPGRSGSSATVAGRETMRRRSGFGPLRAGTARAPAKKTARTCVRAGCGGQ